MKNAGGILLISLYELGHVPMALASPMGFLQDFGFKPTGIDLSIEKIDLNEIKKARFIGISVPMHTALRLGDLLLKQIRSINSKCHICFYGLYASLNTSYLLEHGADSTIGGEFELPLLNLVRNIDEGKSLDSLEGVSLKGKIKKPYIKRLHYSAPHRSSLPKINRYAKLEYRGEIKNVGYSETTRGCKYFCRHCPIPPVYEGHFFAWPKEVVLEDLSAQIQEGARHITFGDPDFLNGPKQATAIVGPLHEKFPEITFDFTTKIEHILKNQHLFEDFAEKGCLFVISAVESLSNQVLHHLKKGHTRNDVLTALNILKNANIHLRPSLVSFTPWTTLDDYVDMLHFIEAHDLIHNIDLVHLTIRLLIPPGSLLLSESSIKPFLGNLVYENFYYEWKHPDPRMDQLWKCAVDIVEKGSLTEEDTGATFNRIYEVAHEMRGTQARSLNPFSHCFQKERPPRITESWFCCAEPSQGQYSKVLASIPFL